MTSAAGASTSAAFAIGLGGSAPDRPTTAALIGLEHEYQLSRAGERLDLRTLIHGLDVPGRRLDPGDANAYRLRSGLALTCDEAEAEIATPPLLVEPGFTRALEAWAIAGRDQLVSLLPAGYDLAGYSTHLSASYSGDNANEVIDFLCHRFAPVLMLVIDRPSSLGVYLRPRPGRIELCGEYVISGYLGAAAALFLGAVRVCAAAVAGELGAGQLPPSLDVASRPATGRFGVYVGRRSAFGFDLYATGRSALMPRSDGDTISVQSQIELAWQSTRPYLSDASVADLGLMDAIVAGRAPLRVNATDEPAAKPMEAPPSHWLGDVLQDCQRPGFSVRASIATWDFTVFRIESKQQHVAYACLPRLSLQTFLAKLHSGELDAAIESYLVGPAGGRLRRYEQTQMPALWDAVDAPVGLLPGEPDPLTGRPSMALVAVDAPRLAKAQTAATRANARPGKLPTTLPGLDHTSARPGKPAIAPARPGKPATAPARPGKPLALTSTPVLPADLPLPLPPSTKGAPLSPVPEVPPPPDVPVKELPAPPVQPEPGAASSHGRPPWQPIVLAMIGVIVAVSAVAGAVGGVFDGGAPIDATPTRTSTPVRTETPRPAATASPSPTETSIPSVTATISIVPVVSPTMLPPATPTRPPTATATPVVVAPATETPVVPTPRPTDVVVTVTPTTTPTATPTPPSATLTPTAIVSPTACPGAICTPTPTATIGAVP